jgi:hypothetical protein
MDHRDLRPALGPALGGIGLMLVLGPVEGLGWRGLALPLLQRRLAPFGAGAIAIAIAISVILTPIFNASGGSVLLAMLFHFQLNNPLWPDGWPHSRDPVGRDAIAQGPDQAAEAPVPGDDPAGAAGVLRGGLAGIEGDAEEERVVARP